MSTIIHYALGKDKVSKFSGTCPLAPELSYKELNVGNGLLARRMWTQVVLEGKHPDRRPQIMEDLSKYCTLDTFAMVRILEVLRKIAYE